MSDDKRPLYGGMGMLDAFLAISERKDEVFVESVPVFHAVEAR